MYINFYVHFSFFLNINLWKTCKIAIAKSFSHVKYIMYVCMHIERAFRDNANLAGFCSLLRNFTHVCQFANY